MTAHEFSENNEDFYEEEDEAVHGYLPLEDDDDGEEENGGDSRQAIEGEHHEPHSPDNVVNASSLEIDSDSGSAASTSSGQEAPNSNKSETLEPGIIPATLGLHEILDVALAKTDDEQQSNGTSLPLDTQNDAASSSQREGIELTQENKAAILGAMKNFSLEYIPDWAVNVAERLMGDSHGMQPHSTHQTPRAIETTAELSSLPRPRPEEAAPSQPTPASGVVGNTTNASLADPAAKTSNRSEKLDNNETDDQQEGNSVEDAPPAQHRATGGGNKSRQQEPLFCQVEGCTARLEQLKAYHQRYFICDTHLKAEHIEKEGIKQRFCQQCGKFQPLDEFDKNKRSCRVRLQLHNARRRKRPASLEEGANPSFAGRKKTSKLSQTKQKREDTAAAAGGGSIEELAIMQEALQYASTVLMHNHQLVLTQQQQQQQQQQEQEEVQITSTVDAGNTNTTIESIPVGNEGSIGGSGQIILEAAATAPTNVVAPAPLNTLLHHNVALGVTSSPSSYFLELPGESDLSSTAAAMLAGLPFSGNPLPGPLPFAPSPPVMLLLLRAYARLFHYELDNVELHQIETSPLQIIPSNTADGAGVVSNTLGVLPVSCFLPGGIAAGGLSGGGGSEIHADVLTQFITLQQGAIMSGQQQQQQHIQQQHQEQHNAGEEKRKEGNDVGLVSDAETMST